MRRWASGIPQYAPGHGALVEAVRAEADGDIVDAAEEEAVQKSKAMAASGSSATPFYQGVGAGGEFGPSGVGGWDDKPTPPAMPDEEQREAWLQQRANGYVIARFTG